MRTPVPDQRRQLRARLFPAGVPALWCPLLTHYTADGAIDCERMAVHWTHLAPWVKGYLIPGSTGDGWELTRAETDLVLTFAREQAAKLNVHLLIGMLNPDAQAARQSIEQMMNAAGARVGSTNPENLALTSNPCGFTVCPPRGAQLTQEAMAAALTSILELGVPLALYQLPQITQNEMSAELVSSLAARFGNFFLFKDSSGADRVALSGKVPDGLFLVRGAEGDYARWLRGTDGPYDGLLLSTANCFARELAQMVECLAARRRTEAEQISARLSSVVAEAFRLVADMGAGNAFANANKALDYFFAFGPRAAEVAPPRLHAGVRLPAAIIRATGDALARHDLMPAKGYLE